MEQKRNPSQTILYRARGGQRTYNVKEQLPKRVSRIRAPFEVLIDGNLQDVLFWHMDIRVLKRGGKTFNVESVEREMRYSSKLVQNERHKVKGNGATPDQTWRAVSNIHSKSPLFALCAAFPLPSCFRLAGVPRVLSPSLLIQSSVSAMTHGRCRLPADRQVDGPLNAPQAGIIAVGCRLEKREDKGKMA